MNWNDNPTYFQAVMDYLPYNLKVLDVLNNEILTLVPFHFPNEHKRKKIGFKEFVLYAENLVILLHSEELFTQPIIFEGKSVFPCKRLGFSEVTGKALCSTKNGLHTLPFPLAKMALEMHLDIHGLLEKGLAKPKNQYVL